MFKSEPWLRKSDPLRLIALGQRKGGIRVFKLRKKVLNCFWLIFTASASAPQLQNCPYSLVQNSHGRVLLLLLYGLSLKNIKKIKVGGAAKIALKTNEFTLKKFLNFETLQLTLKKFCQSVVAVYFIAISQLSPTIARDFFLRHWRA